MSTTEGPDSYRNVYNAWLCDLLGSAASPKLETMVIILDARLIHYTGVAHLVEWAIEFLEQQDNMQIDRMLVDTHFKSLKSVCIHLLCGREATPPDHAQWQSVVAARFPKLQEHDILR